jgi:hypothetical protein
MSSIKEPTILQFRNLHSGDEILLRYNLETRRILSGGPSFARDPPVTNFWHALITLSCGQWNY